MTAPECRITGLAVVSAAGIGPEVFRERLLHPVSDDTAPDPAMPPAAEDGYDGIPGRVVAVPGFEITDFVPRKGTRNLDRTTKLGIATSAQLKQRVGGGAWEQAGVAMGSTAGSVRSSIELDASVLTGGVDRVDPATFPNTTMNCCASQIAIWHGLRGPNSTVANGSVSALSAVQYAARLIRRGHAGRMLVGGVEELAPQTAWGVRLGKDVDESVFIGEGAAMLALQAPGRDGGSCLPTLSSCEVLFTSQTDDAGWAAALGRAVDRALARAGLTDADVDLLVPGAMGTRRWPAEAAVIDRFGGQRVDVRAVVGECGSALGAMQLAAALLLGEPGAKALVTGLDAAGAVGAAVLALGGRSL